MQIDGNQSKVSIALVLKGYPRLSETFIAQEILSLEKAGLSITIVSLRKPTDPHIHTVHEKIKAPVLYLPEYIFKEPIRVLRSWWQVRSNSRYKSARKIWLKHLIRDFSPNRARRWGQALVLAAELAPELGHIYAHFLHTPASVAYYASLLTGRTWSVSSHAKDIWLTPDWEKTEKLQSCAWAVTCTNDGFIHLNNLVPDKTRLSYHGLDTKRLPLKNYSNILRKTDSDDLLRLLSVGRAVKKKGFSVLLEALSKIPKNINWHWTHIGGGTELKTLQKLSAKLGLSKKITWKGAQPQKVVFEAYGESDLFIMPSIIATDGDRDGLPNVLMEAASKGVCCIATDLPGITEFIKHDETGWIVPSNNSRELMSGIISLSKDPAKRVRLAEAANDFLATHFSHSKNVQDIIKLLKSELDENKNVLKDIL